MPNAKSLAVHNLYFSLLCSVDVASAESYVIAAGTLQRFILFQIMHFETIFSRLFAEASRIVIFVPAFVILKF